MVLYFLHGYSVLRLSFLGKASIFAVFSLYGFEIFELMGTPGLGFPPLVDALEMMTGAILLAALVEKVVYLVRTYASYRRSGHEERARRSGPVDAE